jgi:hypothetical protein
MNLWWIPITNLLSFLCCIFVVVTDFNVLATLLFPWKWAVIFIRPELSNTTSEKLDNFYKLILLINLNVDSVSCLISSHLYFNYTKFSIGYKLEGLGFFIDWP